jgi:NTP-dependent ternary system trypsin peptidase co-occuring protein
MNGDQVVVGLAEAIAALRGELTEALKAGKDEPLQFRLGPIELEFQLEVSKRAGGEVGIKFWVVSLGGKAEASRAGTHHIKLSLQPVSPEGSDVQVHSGAQERPP